MPLRDRLDAVFDDADFADLYPRPSPGRPSATPELKLGAWENPLDLLLELAPARKVDPAKLSTLDLAEQLGAALEAAAARRWVPLSRSGDWLVIAAHLALLRSRLLPADSEEAQEARRETEALRRRLGDRTFVRRLADRLQQRPQLGREVFARGRAEEPESTEDRAMSAVADTAICCAPAWRSCRGRSGPARTAARAADPLARAGRLGAAAPPAAHGAGGFGAGAVPAGDGGRRA